MNLIDKLYYNKKNTVTEKELEHLIGCNDYECFAKEVGKLVSQNIISPVKYRKSRTNGRFPPLYNKYRIIRIETDYSLILEKIKLLNPRLNISGYMEKPGQYEKHSEILVNLSDYLWNEAALLKEPMSQKERSLSIWGFEKLMEQKEALVSEVLRFNGLSRLDLNFFYTPEPFIEYVHERAEQMNILIIENKDTWFSFRKAMLECGCNSIFNMDVHALIYGEGRKITGKNGRIDEYDAECYHSNKNTYYYFGDLDYEGIQIFFDLQAYNPGAEIRLLKDAYIMMVKLADGRTLPMSADKRNRTGLYSEFLEYFPETTAAKMGIILESGKYIPQEILNYQIIRTCLI